MGDGRSYKRGMDQRQNMRIINQKGPTGGILKI